MLQEKKGSCFWKDLDDVPFDPFVKSGLIDIPRRSMYGLLLTFTGTFVYWLHQFKNQGCTKLLLVLQCRPLWVPITTLTGVITYNSSYAFMFGHCPIYLHSKRSAQGPAHILLYGMDIATAVFLTPKYRYRGLGGLFTRLLRWDGSQQCQHHHFPNECHHRCEFFLGAEQVVSLGVVGEARSPKKQRWKWRWRWWMQ